MEDIKSVKEFSFTQLLCTNELIGKILTDKKIVYVSVFF